LIVSSEGRQALNLSVWSSQWRRSSSSEDGRFKCRNSLHSHCNVCELVLWVEATQVSKSGLTVNEAISIVETSSWHSLASKTDRTCVNCIATDNLIGNIGIVELCELVMVVCSWMVDSSLGRSLHFLSCSWWLVPIFLGRHWWT
jgi:hypothetical protein